MLSGVISNGIHHTVYTGYCTKSGMLSTVTVELVIPNVAQSYCKRPKPGYFLSTGVKNWVSSLIIKTLIRALVVTFAVSAVRVDEARLANN